jgi:hypothetical protein
LSTFIIIHGKRQTAKRSGYVAEFCPICREIKPLEIIELAENQHIFFAPIGEEKVLGHFGRCAECGFYRATKPASFRAVEKYDLGTLEELIGYTFPTIRSVYRERLALEARVRAAPASLHPADREALLTEAFEMISRQASTLLSSAPRFDLQTSLAFWITLGFVIVSPILAIRFMSEVSLNIALKLILVLAAFGFGCTLLQMTRVGRRIIFNQVLPLLLKSLTPLRPSEAELVTCLRRCQNKGLRIGTAVKAEQLWKALGALT